MCLLIKRLDQEFVTKHGADALKGPTKLLKDSAELLKHLAELLGEHLASSAECFKNLAACLYYNTALAVPISQGIRELLYDNVGSNVRAFENLGVNLGVKVWFTINPYNIRKTPKCDQVTDKQETGKR